MTTPESPEQIRARTGSFGVISVSFPTDARGRTAYMWHVTRDLAERWIAEFSERMGAPHQESLIAAALIDSLTSYAFSKPGLVWVDHAAGD